MGSDLILGPLLQGQMRTAKLKSAYNLLIIGPRGFQCEPNLTVPILNISIDTAPIIFFFFDIDPPYISPSVYYCSHRSTAYPMTVYIIHIYMSSAYRHLF